MRLSSLSSLSSVQDYLLEQSRITHQSEQERNYHVFYQLTAAAQRDPGLAAQYQVRPPATYHYLNQSGSNTLDGVDDAAKVLSLSLLSVSLITILLSSLTPSDWLLKLFKFRLKLRMQYFQSSRQSCGLEI